MAVQIPRLNRMNPVALESAGRLRAEVPNAVPMVAKAQEQIGNLGSAAADYMDRIEREHMDTEASRRENTYISSYESKLAEAKRSQGDPTESYNTLDKDMQEQFDQLTGDPTLPERTRGVVLKRLTNAQNRLQMQRLSEQGNQQAKYEDNVDKANIQIKQNALPDATTYIQPGDPSGFAPFDSLISDITETHVKRALKRGGATEDANGEVSYIDEIGAKKTVKIDDLVKVELGKDISDGVYNAMDNLVKAGDIPKAEALKERYWNYLEPAKKKAMSDDFLKAQIDTTAYKAADSKNPDAVLNEISDPVQRAKARDKSLEIKDARAKRREAELDRTSKHNYNIAANDLQKKMRKDPTAFAGGITELENDGDFKRVIGRVTDAKQKQALYDMVIKPKESSDAAKAKYQNLLFGNDPEHPEGLVGMSPEDFTVYKSGLSKADQKSADRKYEAFNSETGSQQQQHMKAAGAELLNQLAAVGYVRRNRYNPARVAYEQEGKLTEAQNEFIDQIDKLGLDPKQTKDEARRFALAKAKGETYNPPTQVVFSGTRQKVAPVSAFFEPDANGLVKGKTYRDWGIAYRKQFGASPSSLYSREFQDFIKGQK